MKDVHELINWQDPAWPLVQDWIQAAKGPVQVLPVARENRDAALVALQVTTRSPLGGDRV